MIREYEKNRNTYLEGLMTLVFVLQAQGGRAPYCLSVTTQPCLSRSGYPPPPPGTTDRVIPSFPESSSSFLNFVLPFDLAFLCKVLIILRVLPSI